MQSSLLRLHKHASISQFVESLLTKSSKGLLSQLSGVELHVSSTALLFASLVLDFTASNLLFATLLSGLVTLGNDQFGVDGLLVLLLLASDDVEFGLLKDLHTSLFEGLAAEDVE